MTTPSDDPTELWNAAIDEHIRNMDEPALQQAIDRARAAMPADQRPAPTDRATDNANPPDSVFQAATDPRDPAVKRRRVLESIAQKQADAARRLGPADHNGYYKKPSGAQPSLLWGGFVQQDHPE